MLGGLNQALAAGDAERGAFNAHPPVLQPASQSACCYSLGSQPLSLLSRRIHVPASFKGSSLCFILKT